jgi:hypothetical protein
MSGPAAVTGRSFSRAWMTILAERRNAPNGGDARVTMDRGHAK